LFRHDCQSHGGRVLIAVGDKIPCQKLTSPESLEAVYVRLNLPNPITVCAVYVPPNSASTYHETLFAFISDLSNNSDKVIIIGDFNFPDIDWDSLSGNSTSNQFCELLFETGLCQLIDTATHNRVDLLLTNLDGNICDINVHSLPFLESDHLDITFSLPTELSRQTAAYFTFNYSRGDYEGLYEYLSCIDFT